MPDLFMFSAKYFSNFGGELQEINRAGNH